MDRPSRESARSRSPAGTHVGGDAEDVEEVLALAKMEIEHAKETARRTRARGLDAPTPSEEMFGHMPQPIREGMRTVSQWMVNEDAHLAFTRFLSVNGNARMGPIGEKLARDSHLTFTAYFQEVAKCKNMMQWKAKMHATQIPMEAVSAVRTPMECGRALALRFIVLTDPLPTADLADRGKWATPELVAWIEA